MLEVACDLVLVDGAHLEPVADARAEALGEERRHRAVDGELVRVRKVHQSTFDGPPSDGVVVAGEGVRFEHQAAVAGRHEERRHEHDRLDRLDTGQPCDLLVQGLAAQLGDEQVRVTAEVPGVAVGRGVGAAGAGGDGPGRGRRPRRSGWPRPRAGPNAGPPTCGRVAPTPTCLDRTMPARPGNGGSHTLTVGVPAAAPRPAAMRLLGVDPHHPPALGRARRPR